MFLTKISILWVKPKTELLNMKSREKQKRQSRSRAKIFEVRLEMKTGSR